VYRPDARYSQLTGVPPGSLAGAGVSFCAACGMQADFSNGGLVSIQNYNTTDYGTTGHVSIVGSTLKNIRVRAHCWVPS
jgi:hypothetical protein